MAKYPKAQMAKKLNNKKMGMINFKAVFNVIGILTAVLGVFMLLVLPVAIYNGGGDSSAILFAALSTLGVGGITWWLTQKSNKEIGKREGYLVVALGWVFISLFSTLPYLFSGTFTTFADALFESVSGLTTTGASVLEDIEGASSGILLWRSLSQWIGGMGIIVLTIAIFPLLGIGGVELFVAEAPGPKSDKIHPRITETAKRLWFIYCGLTVVLGIILLIGGMTPYDALNHALTTMATGGFSTKNASIAHYDLPIIQYPIIIFMFIAGINYTVIYYSLTGNIKKAWKSQEFRMYSLLTIALIIFITLGIYFNTDLAFEKSFRDAAFQVISLITTTGFVSADYTSWHPVITYVCFLLLFMGACAGSTSGGIKIIRHLVFYKSSYLEFKKLLHPRAVIHAKVDGEVVSRKILLHILVFLLIYMLVFIMGSFVMTFVFADFEQPLLTALGSVATALGNVGPAIGELGPVDNFAKVPVFGKYFLIGLMLLGRLELFTVLILFSPYFWRLN